MRRFSEKIYNKNKNANSYYTYNLINVVNNTSYTGDYYINIYLILKYQNWFNTPVEATAPGYINSPL